jgi:hypothetical protein
MPNDNAQPPTVADTITRLHALPPTALFTSDEAGIYLNVRTDLLRAWRCQGRGPAFVGSGHFTRYRKQDLDGFLAERIGGARRERASDNGRSGDFATAVA